MSLEQAPEQAASPARKMIRKSRLLELIPLSFPTIWGMIRRGEFPAPVKFGPRNLSRPTTPCHALPVSTQPIRTLPDQPRRTGRA